MAQAPTLRALAALMALTTALPAASAVGSPLDECPFGECAQSLLDGISPGKAGLVYAVNGLATTAVDSATAAGDCLQGRDADCGVANAKAVPDAAPGVAESLVANLERIVAFFTGLFGFA